MATLPSSASWRKSVSGARRATGEIVSSAEAAGLLTNGQPPNLPPRLLAALQRQIEPRLEFAQEGSDERALIRAIEDASSIGLPTSRIAEARSRFREVAEAAERRARRASLGLTSHAPPAEFRCPLTLSAMRDPVVASDGHSYERTAIEEVLRANHPRSPLTREALKPELVPNHALRRRIEEHENELDRTLEEVATALRAQAAEKLAAAEAELKVLRAKMISSSRGGYGGGANEAGVGVASRLS